jgi:hypothetical protein
MIATLKPILILLGSLFSSSVIIVVLLKKLNVNFGNLGNKTWWFNIIISAISGALSFLVAYMVTHTLTAYVILSILYTLMGIVFINWAHKKYFKQNKLNTMKQTLSEFAYALSILSFTIMAFVAMTYFIGNKNFMYYPILCAALFFFIPIVLWHAFINATNIPLPIYPYWTYPILEPIELPDEIAGEKILVIGFELSKNNNDAQKSYFRSKAPEDMLLGDLFYHFINDYNDAQSDKPIVYHDNLTGIVDSWLMSLKGSKFKSNRILNSNKSLKENRIKEDDVIICERIQ